MKQLKKLPRNLKEKMTHDYDLEVKRAKKKAEAEGKRVRLPKFNLQDWGVKSENAESWLVLNRQTGEERTILK